MNIGTSLFTFVSNYGPVALFVIIATQEAGIPMPIPADALLLFAGFLISEGALSLPIAVISSLSAAIIGACVLYAIARHGGRPLVKKFGKYIFLPEERLERYSLFFKKHSHVAIILGRYIPGMRVVFSLLGGLMNVPFKQFLGQVSIAASIWVCGLIGIGILLGSQWENASAVFAQYWYIFVIFFVIVIAFSIYRSKPSKKSIARR